VTSSLVPLTYPFFMAITTLGEKSKSEVPFI
jgi:hypothetical protein